MTQKPTDSLAAPITAENRLALFREYVPHGVQESYLEHVMAMHITDRAIIEAGMDTLIGVHRQLRAMEAPAALATAFDVYQLTRAMNVKAYESTSPAEPEAARRQAELYSRFHLRK